MNQTHLGEPLFSPPQAIFVKGDPLQIMDFRLKLQRGDPLQIMNFRLKLQRGDPLQIMDFQLKLQRGDPLQIYYFHKPTEITKGGPCTVYKF